MNNEFEISKASREELEIYLASWGVQCFAHDSNNDVCDRAMETFQNNGPGTGPIYVERSSFSG